MKRVIGNWLPADLVPSHICINCDPIRRTAFDRGPTRDYHLVFAKRLQYVSVPDGSDVAVRTRCFRFFLKRAERRIMP